MRLLPFRSWRILNWPSRRPECRGRHAHSSTAHAVMQWRQPLPVQKAPGCHGASVAIGKFDALHLGHKALAAAAAWGACQPAYLISFSGMAQVLGWTPRLLLVAPVDRQRVFESWAEEWRADGGNVAIQPPKELAIPFDQVRTLDPESFVRILTEELRVQQIVVGKGFRFGYKAAGTTETLRELGKKFSIQVEILDLLEDSTGAISSSKAREELAGGNVDSVAALLGRPYRLYCDGRQAENVPGDKLWVPESGFLNRPPGMGMYLTRMGHELRQVEFVKGGLLMPHKETEEELVYVDLVSKL